VKLRPDGTVKVLDFGLAKATVGDDRTQSHAPTSPVGPTRDGVISAQPDTWRPSKLVDALSTSEPTSGRSAACCGKW
jgi:hypothetical protein